MRIAFVSQPYDRVLPPGQNSIGLIVANSARELAARSDVSVFVNARHNAVGSLAASAPFAVRPVSVPADERMHSLLGRYPRWARRFGVDGLVDAHPQYVQRVGRQLRESSPDVLHIMNYWQWSRGLRRYSPAMRIVLEMQCEWLSQMNAERVARQLEAVSAVVGVSDHIVRLFRQCFPSYQGVIATAYNGVDVDMFRPRERTMASARPPQLLFVSRVSPEKGVHTLIEAFAAVVQRFPTAKLTLVGPRSTLPSALIVDISTDPVVGGLRRFYDGSLCTDYQLHLDDLIERLGLQKHVHFAGFMAHHDLVESYRAADVVVNPSLSESFGIAIVEGMASGVPVVGTRIGGMLETVEDGVTGHLVEPEQPAALARGIISILEDRSLAAAMGECGRLRAAERFSWQARAARLTAVYEQVVSAA